MDRFPCGAKACRLSALRLNGRFCRAFIPFSRIGQATRRRSMAKPLSRSSCAIRGLPQVSFDKAKAERTGASSQVVVLSAAGWTILSGEVAARADAQDLAEALDGERLLRLIHEFKPHRSAVRSGRVWMAFA